MRRITLALVLAVTAVPVLASPCWACSCARLSARAQARAADFVFTGTVVSSTTRANITMARFAVENSFKGSRAAEILVRTPRFTAACGVPLAIGARYTVFGSARGARVETGACMGTVPGAIRPARFGLRPEGPAALGNGAPRPASGQAAHDPPAAGLPSGWGLVIGAVAVGTGALWLWRRSATSATRAEGKPRS